MLKPTHEYTMFPPPKIVFNLLQTKISLLHNKQTAYLLAFFRSNFLTSDQLHFARYSSILIIEYSAEDPDSEAESIIMTWNTTP